MYISTFERRGAPLAPRIVFLRRLAINLALASAAVFVSLVVGMIGYAAFEGLGFVDSFLNAAMILGGMGEVAELHTTGGKLFAGLYALYSGLLVIGVTGFMLAPVIHRVLHTFSAPDDADEDEEAKEEGSGHSAGKAKAAATGPARKPRVRRRRR